MYKIKQNPEDFIVKEIINIETSEGDYSYFWLNKKDMNTLEACQKIADALHIPLKDIGFAGTKDKKAVTEQLISIKNVGKERIEKLRFEKFELEFFGKGKDPISLGDLKGNEFTITLREADVEPFRIKHFVNYFDEQRFSTDNVTIGRCILKKDFKNAAELIAKSNNDVKNFLEEKKSDFINAIRILPKKILSFYINAYQSYLWNEVAAEFVKKHSEKTKECEYSLGKMIFSDEKTELKIPLVGFGTEFENEEIEEIYKKILEKEKINLRDFIIRGIPDLSSEGATRELFVDVEDLKIEIEKDICKLNFKLSKGSYATVAVKAMFCK